MPTLLVDAPAPVEIHVVERERRETALGPAIYIKVFATGYRPLRWREVWEAFAAVYPDRWAVECFPPASKLVDGKAVYHLFVLESEPEGLNIK